MPTMELKYLKFNILWFWCDLLLHRNQTLHKTHLWALFSHGPGVCHSKKSEEFNAFYHTQFSLHVYRRQQSPQRCELQVPNRSGTLKLDFILDKTLGFSCPAPTPPPEEGSKVKHPSKFPGESSKDITDVFLMLVVINL